MGISLTSAALFRGPQQDSAGPLNRVSKRCGRSGLRAAEPAWANGSRSSAVAGAGVADLQPVAALGVDHLHASTDEHPPHSQPIEGLRRVVEITEAGLLVTWIEEGS